MVAGSLVVIFSFVKPQQNSPQTISERTLSVEVTESDHRKGNLDSPIALVEYGDFQCPACRSYAPFIKQIESEFGDRIVIVFRHLPLRAIHRNAMDAAFAAEAAARQGKFWEMHDVLFEKQSEWARENNAKDVFVEYAVSLGLNPDQFREDFESSETADIVEANFQAAIQDGLNSTPSFFLGGVRIQNPQSYEEFQQAILAVLGQSEQQANPSDLEQQEEPADSNDL